MEKDQKIVPCHEANMYLAEDRIFCLELLIKKDENYILQYVPGCWAITDPPYTLIGLLRQRWRWVNGSLFATFHVIKNFCWIWQRENSLFDNIWKMFFLILYSFMIVQTFLSFFLVGLFYAVFSIFIRSQLVSSFDLGFQPGNIVENIYIVLLFFTFVFSTMVSIEKAQQGFNIIMSGFGIFNILITLCIVIEIIPYNATVDEWKYKGLVLFCS